LFLSPKAESIEGLKIREIEVFCWELGSRWKDTDGEKMDSALQAQTSTVTDLIFLFQADKLQTLISAAKVEEVEPIWATIFAKVNI
jgi:hypothetical protein